MGGFRALHFRMWPSQIRLVGRRWRKEKNKTGLSPVQEEAREGAGDDGELFLGAIPLQKKENVFVDGNKIPRRAQ